MYMYKNQSAVKSLALCLVGIVTFFYPECTSTSGLTSCGRIYGGVQNPQRCHLYEDNIGKDQRHLGLGSMGVALSRDGSLSCHIFCYPKRRRIVYDNRWTLRIYPNPCSPCKLNYTYWDHQKWHITIRILLSVDWFNAVLRIPSRKLPSLWRATKLSSLTVPY